jgi:hypothetical protein
MSVVLASWCRPAQIGNRYCSDRVSGCFDVAGAVEVSFETFGRFWNPNGRGAGMNLLEAPLPAQPLHDDGMTPLLRRVRSEFLEMPGLRLTPAQAARLWSLDRSTSDRILDGLTTAGFLSRNRHGAYLLASVG